MFGYLVTSLQWLQEVLHTQCLLMCCVSTPLLSWGASTWTVSSRWAVVAVFQSSFFICFIGLVRATKQCIKRRCVLFSRANEHKPAWQTQKQSLTNTKQTTRCAPIFSIFKPSLFVYGLLYNSLMFFYLRKLLMILRFPSEVLLYMANLTRNK